MKKIIRKRNDGSPWGRRGDFKKRFYPWAVKRAKFDATELAQDFGLSLQDARNRLYKLKVYGKVRMIGRDVVRDGDKRVVAVTTFWELTAPGHAAAKWWEKR